MFKKKTFPYKELEFTILFPQSPGSWRFGGSSRCCLYPSDESGDLAKYRGPSPRANAPDYGVHPVDRSLDHDPSDRSHDAVAQGPAGRDNHGSSFQFDCRRCVQAADTGTDRLGRQPADRSRLCPGRGKVARCRRFAVDRGALASLLARSVAR